MNTSNSNPGPSPGSRRPSSDSDKPFSVTIPVDESRVADLLCTAFEGGVGYWARIIGKVVPEVVWQGGSWKGEIYSYVHYPLSHGGAIILRDAELPDPEDAVEEMGESLEDKWVLDREAIARGLRLFPNHPFHLSNWLNENEDAETGDVFVQLCVLGEIVYG